MTNWPDDIANELPAPRDDEPSSLRQDIADELADHLQSSFVGELHRTPDQLQAKQHVLDRFGDPRRVARQLWFDAMKEKIMSQRVNVVLTSLMTMACLAALGLMTVMLRDSREVNAAILERLQALAIPQPAAPAAAVLPAVDSSRSMDWVPAKFKLVLDTEGSPPAVGFKVHMQSSGKDALIGDSVINGSVVSGQLEMTTGTDGIADLGLCRFGSYYLTASAPWGEQLWRQCSLRPSLESTREIKCPAAPPEQVDVTFSVDWPDDLKEQELWLVCSFSQGNRKIGPENWSMAVPGYVFHGRGSTNNSSIRDLLIINSQGETAIQKTAIQQSVQGGMGGMGGGYPAASVATVLWFDPEAPARFSKKQQLPALFNSFATVSVVRSREEEGAKGWPALAEFGMGGMWGGMGGMGGMGFFNVADQGGATGAPGRDSLASLSFEPKPGQINQWNIRLPEYMLDKVRIKLKLKPDPAAAAVEATENEDTAN